MRTQAPSRNGRRPRHSAGLPAPMHIDRLPPNSIEAEQGFLGCCMLDWKMVVNAARSRIKEPEQLFYDLRHAVIMKVAIQLVEANLPVDLILLSEKLKEQNQLEAVGGISYLSALPDVTPSASNYEYYLSILEEKLQLRRLIQTCTEWIGKAYDPEELMTPEAIIGGAERAILDVRLKAIRRAPTQRELVGQAISDIEELHQRQGAIGGMATGFIDLDKIHDGLHSDEYIVIAAFPSTGKTALALNIATEVALAGNAVGIISQEMKARKLVGRQMAARARVNLRNIRDGYLSERDFPKLAGAAAKLADLPIHWCDTSGLSIYQVMAQARQWKAEHDIKMIVIDYLQLLNADGSGRRIDNREQEVASISRGVKQICGELDLCALALSQLNDDGKVRESRSIEQDADSVWRLLKVDSKEKEVESPDCINIALEIGKQRNGPAPAIVHLTFFKGFTLFENAARADYTQ